jgi:hypothetical protein
MPLQHISLDRFGLALSKPFLASCIGVLAHNLIFIHNEWHLQAPTIVLPHLALALSVIEIEDLITKGFIIAFSDLASLFISITIYKLYFHRL